MLDKSKIVAITDDSMVRGILIDAGRLDQIKVIPPFDTTTVIFNHEGCHCMVINSYGFEQPEDNGLVLIAIPFGAGSFEDVAEFFTEMKRETTKHEGSLTFGYTAPLEVN